MAEKNKHSWCGIPFLPVNHNPKCNRFCFIKPHGGFVAANQWTLIDGWIWFPSVGCRMAEKTLFHIYFCFTTNSCAYFFSAWLESSGTAIPYQIVNPNSTHCVNWNQYYTNCTQLGGNPFQGTISFDNIGLAWVAIFLVTMSFNCHHFSWR